MLVPGVLMVANMYREEMFALPHRDDNKSWWLQTIHNVASWPIGQWCAGVYP